MVVVAGTALVPLSSEIEDHVANSHLIASCQQVLAATPPVALRRASIVGEFMSHLPLDSEPRLQKNMLALQPRLRDASGDTRGNVVNCRAARALSDPSQPAGRSIYFAYAYTHPPVLFGANVRNTGVRGTGYCATDRELFRRLRCGRWNSRRTGL